MLKQLLSITSAAMITVLLTGAGLTATRENAVAAELPEVIVDDDQATTTGSWTESRFKPNFYGDGYRTTPKAATATATIRWTPDVPEAGTYGVYYRLPDGGHDRAWDIPFVVHDELGDVGYSVDARPAPGGTWVLLGNHVFAEGVSGYVEATNKAGAIVVVDAIRLGPPTTELDYHIRPDIEKQQILGIGVEIQNDSIGSGNSGLPDDSPAHIPADLTESERQRLYDEMLTGFRYVRLAMGLYLRGVSDDGKNIVERYPDQMALLRELIDESGIEGVNVEYWSPAPYWKDNNSLIHGNLDLAHIEDQAARNAWVDEYSDAMMQDIQYLEDHGIDVRQWSLQNEPTVWAGYSSIYMDHPEYFEAFRAMAAKIAEYDPSILVHADSHHGQYGQGAEFIREGMIGTDGVAIPPALEYLDAWSHHRNWGSSDDLINDQVALNSKTGGKQVFNSEWEFLDGVTNSTRMVETAQSIMNWMTFMDAPTWYWLHALKPTYNEEAVGYGLGLWRPSDDPIEAGDPYADIAPQHWKPILTNWNGVAPFVQHLEWDSTRLQVDERIVRKSQRIMAWETPSGELGLALTNRSDVPFRFNIDLGSEQTISGHRYDATATDVELAAKSGQVVQIIVPPKTIEVWTAESTPVLTSLSLASDDTTLTVGEEIPTQLSGTMSDGTPADLQAVAVSYASSDPSVATVNADGVVTAVTAGVAQISASADAITSAPLAIDVEAPPLAAGKPGKPVLSDDAGHAHGLKTGDYTITMDMWWGDNGSRFRLFENGVLIDDRSLVDASPNRQSVRVGVSGKADGEYVYRAELSNAHGTTISKPLVVRVTDAAPGKPVLSHDNWDHDGNFSLSTDLWWGTNATEYRLFEDGVLVASGPLTAATPDAQHTRTEIRDREPGVYSYRVELSNAAGTTSSDSVVVSVER